MADYSGLHWMTASLFLAAGAEAALGERRGDYRASEAIRWAPFVAAPLAGAAQAARALAPSDSTRMVARIASAAAIGVGVAGLLNSVTAARRAHQYDDDDAADRAFADRIPSLAPLAFGAVGLLALLLDSEENEDAIDEEEIRSAKRAAPRSARGRVKHIRIRV